MRKLLLACAFGLAAPAFAQQAPATPAIACMGADSLALGTSRASPLHLAPLAGAEHRIYRLYGVEIGPGTETARSMKLGDEVTLVTGGAVILELPDEEPQSFQAGQVLHLPPMVPHVLRNASASEPARLLVSSITAAGLPPSVPVPSAY